MSTNHLHYKFVLVSTQKQWHGGEEQARLLAAGLRRHGHDVLLLAPEGSQFTKRMRSENFEVQTFAGRGRSPQNLFKIRQMLSFAEPDVLIYNDAHALTSAGLAASGLPITVRLAMRRVNFSLQMASRYSLFSDRVLCVSSAVAAACRISGLSPDLLRVVHDGVDPTRAQNGNRQLGRESLGLNNDHFMLLTTATLTDPKGHRYLLEAMPEVIQNHPNVRLMLAGDGELLEELQTFVQNHNLSNHVQFLGFRNDIPDLLQGADLFVMPSHQEGLNTSIIDAMFAECPVVATSAGGIPDLLVDHSLPQPISWSVAPKNPVALSKAISEAIANPKMCKKRAAGAKKRAEHLFSAERMVTRTLAICQEVFDEKRSLHSYLRRAA
ncbi:MAG: glycosyltransferase family 4 protein [Pirellulaceae bacterium]|nr:glycosyltransferase family 4 protein [Pirellulaceae bacterium]